MAKPQKIGTRLWRMLYYLSIETEEKALQPGMGPKTREDALSGGYVDHFQKPGFRTWYWRLTPSGRAVVEQELKRGRKPGWPK